MLAETLEKAWQDRQGERALEPVMAFGPEGLTLGAGTVLAPGGGADRAIALDEETEARLSALLTSAYVRPIAPQTLRYIRPLRYIRRGAASWRQGDTAMAAMHLAMTGLPRLQNPKAAARRLFMADMLMKAGAEPGTILQALDLEAPLRKAGAITYNPSEPCNHPVQQDLAARQLWRPRTPRYAPSARRGRTPLAVGLHV